MNNELTKRELEVMELIVKGLDDKEIADKLFISCLTVRTHKAHIYEKYSVNGDTARVKAVIKYLKYKRGLDMFENYEDENASFSENENKIPYLELAKQTGANRCIHFNWSNNINETCYKSDKDINKCLLLGGTKCNKSGVENE